MHDLWIEKGMWETDEKKSNEPNKNDTSKGWVTNIEIKITRRKIENEGRNKVNDSTV